MYNIPLVNASRNGTEKFLPKDFDLFGVSVSPLGRRATVDTIVFRQLLTDSPETPFSFWLDTNIEIRVYKLNRIWALEVSVYSLSRFANNRSSSLINDYLAVLVNLEKKINSELVKRKKSGLFSAFESEIIRLDLFIDLRFKSKSEMRRFFENFRKFCITNFALTTEYPNTFYIHNGLDLKISTEFIKLYDKENRQRKNKSDELNRNKSRLEISLQNKMRSKVLNDAVKELNLQMAHYVLATKHGTFLVENKYQSNAFTLLNPTAINRIFERSASQVLA